MSHCVSDFFSENHCGGYEPGMYYDSYPPFPSAGFSYPSYDEFDEPQFLAYHDQYQYRHPQSLISYSVSNPSTFFSISHSAAELAEPEFSEYDPTPYGGGYDIAATYGKPLPPSDEICYPRSVPIPSPPLQDDPRTVSLDPLPGKEEIVEPASEEIDSSGNDKEDPEEPPPPPPMDVGDSGGGESGVSDAVIDVGYPYPWCGYGGNGFSSVGRSEEIRVPEPDPAPVDYNPEAMDLCESLFGYWPCLYRKQRRNQEEIQEEGCDRGGHCDGNSLTGAADYIFGNSYPPQFCDGSGDGSGASSAGHGYERRVQNQSFPWW